MNTSIITEQPLYYYLTSNGKCIELYRKDFDKMKVGDKFSIHGWYSVINATEDECVEVTCVYKDTNGVLLREYITISYRNVPEENRIKIELIWIELKGNSNCASRTI